MKVFKSIVSALILLLFIFSSCSNFNASPVESNQNLARAVLSEGSFVLNDKIYFYEEGVLGPGAFYSITYPEQWMGELVIYAHGYVAQGLEFLESDEYAVAQRVMQEFRPMVSPWPFPAIAKTAGL